VTDSIPILGVDFSGAKADKDTWVTQGVLADGVPTIDSCQSMRRADLAELLASLPGTAVAALDFPVSVPSGFAQRWLPGADTMPKLWEAAAAMESSDFMALRDDFVAEHGEPLRRGDLYFPECYSCLHKANPNMVPMTFRGMQMLDQLGRNGCSIPPLAPPAGAQTLLLEAMPGAALRALGLPFKGYKKGVHASQLRRTILEGLAEKSGLRLPNLGDFYDLGMANHDGLDSLVAAVVAALWAQDPTKFRRPAAEGAEEFDSRVMLEGWLYAPVFI